ncbi:TIGR01841 family phasin [Xanthobacter sp. V4C-4]|uniref:phasin family protein n=1 Tax=Xanthobacter cornucopiae TaxID=3119924 RepID=UPI0037265EFA
MTKFGPNLELPSEVRAIAEKNVAQAREAFETLFKNTREAVGDNEGHLEEVRAGVTDLRQKALGLVEANVEAGFDFLQKLVSAKTPQEALTLQAEFLSSQVQKVADQAKELSSDAKSLGETTARALDERAKALAERVRELSAAAAQSAQSAAADLRSVSESVINEAKAKAGQALDPGRKA